MATVSNPATLSSVKSAFGGTGALTAYYRGGPYVPIGASSGISTSAGSLALSQFNGVSAGIGVSIAPSSVSGSASGAPTHGTVHTGSAVATAVNNTGTVSYSWSVSGASGIATPTISGGTTNTASFTGTCADGVLGTMTATCTVTDSLGSASASIPVSMTWSSTM